MDDRALVAAAREAALNAYAPYSGFRVGAVVVAADGSIYPGANIENSAYPSTVCAEATAIAHAASS
ncbi:MAG: cytidine deaminase, partial [Acidimicrobiia bacterium]|nr:cytidine deaminase [Acidimicrobiia bacterium]